MRNWTAAILIVLLAGCMGEAPGPSSESGNTPASSPEIGPFDFTQIQIGAIPIENFQARNEAFVATSNNQTIVCGHGVYGGPALAWAAIDGFEFSPLEFPPEALVAGDCDVQIGPDGTWYVLHHTPAGATLTSSNNQGEAWTTNSLTTLPVGFVDRPWLAADEDLHLTTMGYGGTTSQVLYTRSPDGGATWTPPVPIAPSDTNGLQRFHGRASIVDGEIIVPLRAFTDYNQIASINTDTNNAVTSTFEIARSADDGATWTLATVAGPTAGRVSPPELAVSEDGWFVMPMLVFRDGATALDVVVSSDLQTWSEPIAIQEGLAPVRQVSIEGGPGDQVSLSWVGQNATGGGATQLYVADFFAGDGAFNVTAIRPAPAPEFVDLAFGQDGLVVAHVADETMLLQCRCLVGS